VKLVEFTYTKKDGSVSQRAVAEVASPTQYLEGVDISELEEAEFANFTLEYNQLKDRQKQEFQELLNQFDLKHNYRRFLPQQMSAITTEHV
jgi:hypothetical protein